jgi:hypothetical protein
MKSFMTVSEVFLSPGPARCSETHEHHKQTSIWSTCTLELGLPLVVQLTSVTAGLVVPE